jgi:long-chain fatty acid transport protein
VRWSAVEELAVTFDDPAQAPVASPADWHDTVRLSAGVIHEPNDRWTLRGGFAYAPSPVPDRTRNARLADSDRLWFAGGASWAASKAVSIDFAYVYVRQDDAPIDFTSPLAGRIAGNVDWNVHVISFGVSSRF